MFIDRARVFVKAGDGGDGMSSFRREKYVPNGGPSGGDGGKGADVVFKADKNINTLVDFRYKRQFKAPAGGNGESSNKHGRGSNPLIIPVPLGTVIKDEETGEYLIPCSMRIGADNIDEAATFADMTCEYLNTVKDVDLQINRMDIFVYKKQVKE